MTNHPVELRIEPPARLARIHVFIRLALLLAVGTIGLSSIYWLLYLALPALAAAVIVQKGGERFLAEEGPRAIRVLKWLAAAYGYLWLLTDTQPSGDAPGPVELEVDVGGTPNPTSALLRLLYSLPALLLFAVLSLVAGVLWVVGAIFVLIRERLPGPIFDFLALTLRVQMRLFAYHLSLVDRYPSLEESGVVHAAT